MRDFTEVVQKLKEFLEEHGVQLAVYNGPFIYLVDSKNDKDYVYLHKLIGIPEC